LTAYQIRSVADAEIPAMRPREAPDFVNEVPVDRRPYGQKLMPRQWHNGVMAQGRRGHMEAAMKRAIGDFDICWVGAFVQAKRKTRPRHTYEYSVSGDRPSIDKLYWTARGLNDGPRMTPLSDIPRFEAAARAAAEEFLRLEQGDEGTPLRLVE
jgi:hypothetical protein